MDVKEQVSAPPLYDYNQTTSHNEDNGNGNVNNGSNSKSSQQQPRQLPAAIQTTPIPPSASRPPSKSHSLSTIKRDQLLGPYILGKTLGAGASGRVKLGTHSETGEKVAVKIIPKISPSSGGADKANGERQEAETAEQQRRLQKLEREIAIMKLIRHPNVLCLHDVYESKDDLFLVMDYVDGGELFDYLVKKKRLDEAEAKQKFRQIIAAVDYCHRHLITHRDLKLENILLDSRGQVKVADFGMASIQARGRLLETSCGSPHYASPEVIKGLKYQGEATDVWSCGVILYAILAGCLPFDDPSTRQLLHKVRRGTFHMPSVIGEDAADLIKRMLTVDAEERITLSQIRQHRWLASEDGQPEEIVNYIEHESGYSSPLNNPPSADALRPYTEENIENIDAEIMETLVLLGYGPMEEILKALCAPEPNFEKVFYWLLDQKKTEQLENFNPPRDSVLIQPSTTTGSGGGGGGGGNNYITNDDDFGRTPRKRVSSRSSIGANWRTSSMFLTPNGSTVDLSVLRTITSPIGVQPSQTLDGSMNFPGSNRNSTEMLSMSPPLSSPQLFSGSGSTLEKKRVVALSRPINPSPLSAGILSASSQLADREEQDRHQFHQDSFKSPISTSASSPSPVTTYSASISSAYNINAKRQPISPTPSPLADPEMMEEFRRLQLKQQKIATATAAAASLPTKTISGNGGDINSSNNNSESYSASNNSQTADNNASSPTSASRQQHRAASISSSNNSDSNQSSPAVSMESIPNERRPAVASSNNNLNTAKGSNGDGASGNGSGGGAKTQKKRFDLLAKIRGATRSVFGGGSNTSTMNAVSSDNNNNNNNNSSHQSLSTATQPSLTDEQLIVNSPPARPDSPMISIDPLTTKSWFDSLLKFRPGTFQFQQTATIADCKLIIMDQLQNIGVVYQSSQDGQSIKCRYQLTVPQQDQPPIGVKFRITLEPAVNPVSSSATGPQKKTAAAGRTLVTFSQQQGALSAFNRVCEQFSQMHDNPDYVNEMK